MLALEDPQSLPSALEAVLYVAGALAAIILGALGYNRKPSVQAGAGVSVAGAIVDNNALQPLLQRFDALILRLDRLTDALEREIEFRRREAEEETLQRRINESVEDVLKKMMRGEPAEMPPVRR